MQCITGIYFAIHYAVCSAVRVVYIVICNTGDRL